MSEVKEVKIDAETLENQDTPISEEQNEAIALQALAESEGKPKDKKEEKPEAKPEEKKEEKKEEPVKKEDKKEVKKEDAPPEDTVLTDEELLSTEDEKLSEEQKTKKVELVKGIDEEKVKVKKEEDELIAKDDKDLSDEEKTRKVDIVKAREEDVTKTAEEEVKSYAKEHEVTEEEAREELESIAKIQEKYKDDPKQLAKANLYLQRLYSKLEKDTKAEAEAKPPAEVTVEAVEKYIEDGQLKVDGKSITKEQTIKAYKDAYPEITEDMEDEKVFKLAAKEWKQVLDKENVKAKGAVSVKAQEKRGSMYDSIPEEDKKFIPDVKPLIEKLSDTQIASEGFDVNTYVQFVKGKNYDSDTKKLTDEKKTFGIAEYKRGLEDSKILGTKRAPEGGAPSDKKTTLTDAQKKRAEEMFDSPGITKEMAYESFKDYLKENPEE